MITFPLIKLLICFNYWIIIWSVKHKIVEHSLYNCPHLNMWSLNNVFKLLRLRVQKPKMVTKTYLTYFKYFYFESNWKHESDESFSVGQLIILLTHRVAILPKKGRKNALLYSTHTAYTTTILNEEMKIYEINIWYNEVKLKLRYFMCKADLWPSIGVPLCISAERLMVHNCGIDTSRWLGLVVVLYIACTVVSA